LALYLALSTQQNLQFRVFVGFWYNVFTMKKLSIYIAIIAILGVGVYLFIQKPSAGTENAKDDTKSVVTDTEQGQVSEQTQDVKVYTDRKTVIGTSVEGRDIVAYNYGYGTGDTKLLFVGGIHGGYEWNTAMLAYDMMDYLDANLGVIPKNVQVTIIPVLNPDGLNKTVGTTGRFVKSDVPSDIADTVSGRFNANDVDLNRNFDCDWQTAGTWQDKTVSGGSGAFSELESKAIRDYVNANNPSVVVVWYSAAGGVFASNCHNGILPETTTITNIYADASGYPAYKDFDFYKITGDMVNWLAKKNIPAISVLLSNHTDVEFDKNKAGVEALLKYYAK
jgi:hypothetical protein